MSAELLLSPPRVVFQHFHQQPATMFFSRDENLRIIKRPWSLLLPVRNFIKFPPDEEFMRMVYCIVSRWRREFIWPKRPATMVNYSGSILLSFSIDVKVQDEVDVQRWDCQGISHLLPPSWDFERDHDFLLVDTQEMLLLHSISGLKLLSLRHHLLGSQF